MKKILLIYQLNSPSAELTKKDLESWKACCQNDALIKCANESSLTDADINWCDCIMFIRGVSVIQAKICKKAAALGKFCILMIDDNMLNPPKGYILHKKVKKAHRSVVKNCSLILVCNPLVGKIYSDFGGGKRTVATNTQINESSIYEHNDEENKTVKIVYPTNADHIELFKEYVAPVLNEVKAECKNEFDITFVGIDPDVSGLEGIKIEKIPYMPFSEYNEFMAKSNFDIGIAPLHDDDFSRCKYINKYLDYAKFGIVGIFTDCMPYTMAVQDGRNGLLCKNDSESWKKSLIKLIDGEELRKEMRREIYSDIRKNFSPQAISEKLDKDIPELGGFDYKGKPFKGMKRIIFSGKLFKMRENIYKFVKMLGRDGIKRTLGAALAHSGLVKSYGELDDTNKKGDKK